MPISLYQQRLIGMLSKGDQGIWQRQETKWGKKKLLAIAEGNGEQTQFLRTLQLFSKAKKITRITRIKMKLILGKVAYL